MDETKYVKHEFKSGEKLYAAQLNEMDAQIALNEENISLLNTAIANLGGSLVEPADDDIPRVYVWGNTLPTTKTDTDFQFRYISKTEDFEGYAVIKCQGASSMNYAKKNFTVKLYADEAHETKMKKDMRGWGKQNKFVWKANWIDHSHARNITNAHLWAEIIKTRSNYDTLPEEYKASPNLSAIDGFPIKLYANGTYQGIYTWNIPKDAWMTNMDEDNPNHILFCCSDNDNDRVGDYAFNFRALWGGISEKGGWDIEVGTQGAATTAVLNNLISHVKDTDDATFKANLDTYLDVQSAIDYLLFIWAMQGVDSAENNMLLITYDGKKLYCGGYDMDATWGISGAGAMLNSYTYDFPADYMGDRSLLWERMLKLYIPEIKARWAELRETVLNPQNIDTKFEEFWYHIGTELLDEDVSIWTGVPSKTTNNIKQIRDFVRDRLNYVDGKIDALSVAVPCTGITLDKTAITIDGVGAQTLTATVTPADTTEAVLWTTSDNSVAIVRGGVVTSVANGNAIITATCGSYSATCEVTVTGVEQETPIDAPYPLANVTWMSEQRYNPDTGVLESNANNHCTSKFKLAAGHYKYTGAYQYPIIYVWDNTGAYMGYYGYLEPKTNGLEFWVGGEGVNYTYAFCVADTAFDANNHIDAFVKVGNSDTAIAAQTLALKDMAWTEGGTTAVWTKLTDYVSGIDNNNFSANVDSINFLTVNCLINGATDKLSADLHHTRIYYYQGLLIYYVGVGNVPATAVQYFTENDTKLIINSGTIGCTGITLDRNSLTFTDTTAQTLTATVTPTDCAQPVTWESSDTGVATVLNGVVTPVANGTTTITATCGNYSATCSVTVQAFESIYPFAIATVHLKSKRDDTTGAIIEDTSGWYATTDPISLPVGCYQEITNNSVFRLHVWNAGGNYLGYWLLKNQTFWISEKHAGYKFAISAASNGITARQLIETVVKVDNSATAIAGITVNLKDLTWTKSYANAAVWTPVADAIPNCINPATEISTMNITGFTVEGGFYNDTKWFEGLVFIKNNEIWYMQYNSLAADINAAVQYFTENDIKLIINGGSQ